MAKANRVEVEIVATDEATPTIAKLEKRIDGLEADEARIIVTAETEKLDQKLSDALAKMKDLEGDELTVHTRVVGTLEDDLIAANKLLEQLDGKTGTVKIDADTTAAKQGIDDLGKSADSSKSVLANMVGNATQDLGALGGIAGSAGVAIGQMGEYMLDARNSGDSLGQVLGNFAKVAGPIAAISGGIFLLTQGIAAYNKPAKEAEERTKALGESMGETADDAIGFAGVLRDNEAALRDFIAASNDPLGAFGVAVDETFSKVPLVGQFFKEAGTDIIDVADRAGISIYEMAQRIEGGAGATANFNDELDEALRLGNISKGEWKAMREQMDLYEASANRAEQTQGLFNVSLDEANALMDEIAKRENPMQHFTDLWSALMEDMRDGTLDTQYAAFAINFLADQLGITQEAVVELARAELDKQLQDDADAAKELDDKLKAARESTGDFTDEINDAVQAGVDFAEKMRGASSDLRDLAADIDSIEADALSEALDFGDAPLDTLTNIQGINQEIRDLADWVKTNGIPNIFDPNDVNADDFLNQISSLKQPIHDAISQAFAESGTGAATALSQQFITQLASQTGLSASTISTLLGLDSLEASIDVAINETAMAKARRQLEILVGVQGGYNYWTASIALALDTGAITPENAQLLVQQALRGEGVTIPSELAVPNTASAIARAQQDADNGPPVLIPTQLDYALGQSSIPNYNINNLPTASTVNNNTYLLPQTTPDVTYDNFQVFVSRNGVRQG